MTRISQLVAATLAVAFLTSSPTVASAATITWQPSVNMYQGATVETFVSTAGDVAAALNASGDTSGDEDTTVNGVAFTGAGMGVTVGGTGTETITINGGSDNVGSFGDGEFTSNGAIFHLIRGAVFGVDSVTLSGLQSGQQYLVQVFNNDARGNRNLNFIAGYGDGTGSTEPVAFSDLNNSPVDGSAPVLPQTDAGDSIIGTFTADSATQSFNVFGSNGGAGSTFTQGDGRAQINAIQLRLVPEPASLALLAMGCFAMLGGRRRA